MQEPAVIGRKTILLVDDEATICRLLERVLTSAGYRVLVTANGGEARAVAALAEVDLLMTDVHMPGERGPTLARALKAQRPALKVVYISGHACAVTDADRQDAHVLTKPFTPNDVVDVVREIFSEASPHDASPRARERAC